MPSMTKWHEFKAQETRKRTGMRQKIDARAKTWTSKRGSHVTGVHNQRTVKPDIERRNKSTLVGNRAKQGHRAHKCSLRKPVHDHRRVEPRNFWKATSGTNARTTKATSGTNALRKQTGVPARGPSGPSFFADRVLFGGPSRHGQSHRYDK